MRRPVASVALITALAAVAAAPAAAGSARHGVTGRVIDVTCPGPCAPETVAGHPYTGEARVIFRRRRDGARAAGAEVRESRFRETLPRGRYELEVRIADPCWTQDPATVRVRRRGFERVRLRVRDRCVRGPGDRGGLARAALAE